MLIVLFTFFIIPSSAADSGFQTIRPISVNNFAGNYLLVAFPGAHSLPLADNTTVYQNFIGSDDYAAASTRVLTGTFYGQTVQYFQLYFSCNYESIYLNNSVYSPGTSSDPSAILFGITSVELNPVSHSFSDGISYTYYFNIVLGQYSNYSDVFEEGFLAGVNSTDAKDKWYEEGYQSGFVDGQNASQSSLFGQNLIGDTLSAPMRALNSFLLFESPSGVQVTLGMVFGSMIGLVLFIAFLKLFAGG